MGEDCRLGMFGSFRFCDCFQVSLFSGCFQALLDPMGRTVMVSECRVFQVSLRVLMGVSLFLLCGAWMPSCKSSCQQLSVSFCKHFQQEKSPELCRISKDVLEKPSTSPRRCRALLETWPTIGVTFSKKILVRYKANKARIEKMSFKRAKKQLEEEHQRFRKSFARLLSFSWKSSKPRVKPKKRRIRRRRRRRRRKRRSRRRKRSKSKSDD